ncbi:Sugar kinase of the NBD/HSP70 family, may contain an N-terminal HTH domain [Asanoa hainanensis]|uniref:Sugar kinase of the NBD/HSP70 family, may contain an N-terminal HTH domain n=1 Tax=Asanoa hainanensis TaxID=560556 RepID=A0A239NXE2_9ACTN|nr:ROK family protein [Asanoa hainanensis]SNT59420.1 Sugar kinase of the NBD/HSP70 family, may contain an N-terminal HTH domain [Asanoa hainanensis]
MIVGVDLGGTKMLLAARGPDGSLVRSMRVPTGPSASPDQIEAYIRAFAGALPEAPSALGVAVPGLVDADRVEISDVLPHLSGWRPLDLLGVPQILVNDIRAALAHTSRTLPTNATAAVVVAGTAIGMAWMADGRVVNGVSGWAGELGSIPVQAPGGGTCRLDEVAGGAAILSATGLTPTYIHAALRAADPQVVMTVRVAGEALGRAIATVVNLLNPQSVLLAGGTLDFPGYLRAALTTAEEHALPQLWRACTVRQSEDGGNIVVLGALDLAERLLADGADRSGRSPAGLA